MENSYTPLHYPKNWPDIKPEQISRLYRIPIINLLMKWNIAFTKWSHAYREIYKQLVQRGSVPVEIWGEELPRIYIARILEKTAQQDIWDENAHFIPEDSFDIVFNLTIGDLCETEALMNLEDIFDENFMSDETFMDSLFKANMSEAVDLFLDRITYTPNKYKVYLEEKTDPAGKLNWFINKAAVWFLLTAAILLLLAVCFF